MQLGLLGYPIQHSLSPWIHNQFSEQINQLSEYQLFEISQDKFNDNVSELKFKKLDGFNVTVPYKQRIIPYLDELDIYADEIGAVNTVVCKNNKWIGYNTDGLGYVVGLKSAYPHLFSGDKKVLVLGAGGASRGIYYALCKEKFAAVDLANRTVEKAAHLLDLNQLKDAKSEVFSFTEAEKNLANYDLVIQTTSVGMKPNDSEKIIGLDLLSKGTVVSDIVYQPFTTRLLREAKTRGALIHHGHHMLLYQAKLAFELWSGQQVDAEQILPQLTQKIKKE